MISSVPSPSPAVFIMDRFDGKWAYLLAAPKVQVVSVTKLKVIMTDGATDPDALLVVGLATCAAAGTSVEELQPVMKNLARDALIAELARSNLENLQERLITAIFVGVEQDVINQGKAKVSQLNSMMKKATYELEAATKGHNDVAREVGHYQTFASWLSSNLKILQEALHCAEHMGVDVATLKAAKAREAEILPLLAKAMSRLEILAPIPPTPEPEWF